MNISEAETCSLAMFYSISTLLRNIKIDYCPPSFILMDSKTLENDNSENNDVPRNTA